MTSKPRKYNEVSNLHSIVEMKPHGVIYVSAKVDNIYKIHDKDYSIEKPCSRKRFPR
jgi:hypothetical protein